MAVPVFQDLTLPLLILASDGKEHKLSDCYKILADEFGLSPEDRAELLPSGKATRFRNRVSWASTYLKKTTLLESTGRGRFIITPRGTKVLNEKPERIDLAYLSRFPELAEFRSSGSDNSNGQPKQAGFQSELTINEAATPEEQVESLIETLNNEVGIELLGLIKKAPPEFFERLVVELLVEMGYGGNFKDAAHAVGGSGDGGIDGIIKEDRLGLDAIYVQAKRWDGTVGRPVIQAFAGSLDGFRATKGVVLTTSSFSKDAIEYAAQITKSIVLIDGQALVRHLMEFGIAVNVAAKHIVREIDQDYFDNL